MLRRAGAASSAPPTDAPSADGGGAPLSASSSSPPFASSSSSSIAGLEPCKGAHADSQRQLASGMAPAAHMNAPVLARQGAVSRFSGILLLVSFYLCEGCVSSSCANALTVATHAKACVEARRVRCAGSLPAACHEVQARNIQDGTQAGAPAHTR